MSIDTIFVGLLVLLLAVVLPLIGKRDRRLLQQRLDAGDTEARVKLYKGILLGQWPLTIALLVGGLAVGYGLQDIRL